MNTILSKAGGKRAAASSSDFEGFLEPLEKAIDRLIASGVINVQMISDYPPGDQADAKMATATLRHMPEGVTIGTFLPTVSVPSLDTVRGGFRTAMLALAPAECRSSDVLFYLNVAPIAKQTSKNGEHKFCLVLLTNGALVASPLAGESLSSLRNWIKHIYVLDCDQVNKQFRSWQVFPKALGRAIGKDFGHVAEVISGDEILSLITELSENDVVDDDSFGNLRTAITREEFEARGIPWGSDCRVLRDGIHVANAIFGDPQHPDESKRRWLSFRPGSNIIEPHPDSPTIDYLDLFRVRGNARRICVLDTENYPMTLRGGWKEATAVASRALRTAGIIPAIKGLVSVFTCRAIEWWSDVGDYDRHQPVCKIERR